MVYLNKTDERTRANESMNTSKFTDLLFILLKKAWGNDWGVFTDSHPTMNDPKNFKFPQIVYELKMLQPGSLGSNKEIKPRFRDYTNTGVNGEKEYIREKGQTMDCTYRFYVYGNSNLEAENLTLNFLDLIGLYTGYLKSKGLKEIILSGVEKKDGNSVGDACTVYLIQYDVQLEFFFNERVAHLEEIEVKVEDTYSKWKDDGSLPSQNDKNKTE